MPHSNHESTGITGMRCFAYRGGLSAVDAERSRRIVTQTPPLSTLRSPRHTHLCCCPFEGLSFCCFPHVIEFCFSSSHTRLSRSFRRRLMAGTAHLPHRGCLVLTSSIIDHLIESPTPIVLTRRPSDRRSTAASPSLSLLLPRSLAFASRPLPSPPTAARPTRGSPAAAF